MKKTLALVLALAMVFSTITVAFAEGTLGADAQICADLGMLKGETGTVDAAYVATTPTRLQAAVMFLRLKGLEAEALAFTGEENFADGNIAWAEGANLLAYLKANPQLGWVGDGVNFNPSAPISAKEYYKVLLETLGYKQTTTEVVGDFTWENVIEFAATVGLSKVADVANFTVNDLAVATVEALKLNVKDTEKTLLATLVEAGKITEEAAVATGLMEGAAQGGALTAEVDDVYAVGNAVVQVEFVDPVDEAAASNLANYSIEGLAIDSVTYVPAGRANGDDRVLLYTAAQTAGKLYTLTVGDKTVQFSGLAKLSDGPEIDTAEDGATSTDVEEVVINFDRNIDYATGTDVANYTISGVTIVKAEVDRDEVTLTTEGLKNGSKYTVKCNNIKSVDLVNRKTTSDDFKVDYDTNAPKISGDVKVDTNTRIIVTFNEKVDEATAEDLANYSIKVNETDGAALDIVSIEWDSDDENNVEITTESMNKKDEYKLTVSGIADQCKVPNVMAKATSKTFDGKAEDKAKPALEWVKVMSPTKFMVRFKDESRFDAASVLDKNNYSFKCNKKDLDIEDITEHDSDTGYFEAIFTVEEMETDKSCELTYVDILDEYGNAMKEDSKIFTASAEKFTSARLMTYDDEVDPVVNSIVATGENTVMVYFDPDGQLLDEDSAENIANYLIDGDVGIPTKAEFEVDNEPKNSVKLTVNDMIGGYGYTLTIDGLKDLAGNELGIVERDFDADAAVWGDAVELDDADATNSYVAQLSFDREVDFNDGANVVLKAKKGDVDQDPVTLLAGRTTDDDQAIEFADFANGELLDPTVTYTVYEVNGVIKMDGTPFVLPADLNLTFNGSDDEYDYVEFDSYEQVDAKTFKVIMTDAVHLDGYVLSKVVTLANGTKFKVTIDDSTYFDDETVYFELDPATYGDDVQLGDGTEYTFNLNQILFDANEVPVGDDDDVVIGKDGDFYNVPESGATVMEGDDKDSDTPAIDEVVAKNRQYILITFDENVNVNKTLTKSDFTLTNVDLDKTVTIDNVKFKNLRHTNKVVITLSGSALLEGRYEYELKMKAGAVEDYANHAVAADTYTFDGTYLAEHE